MVLKCPWPYHLEYPVIPIYEQLRGLATKFPEKPALIFEGVEYTYALLDELSDRFATFLHDKLEVKKGDRVAIHLPNIPQYIIAFYGILKAGGMAVPVSTAYRENELLYQLRDSKARILITIDELYSIVLNIKQKAGIENVVLASLKECLPLLAFRGQTSTSAYDEAPLRFSTTLDAPSRLPDVHVNPKEDVAILCYTGGTTGIPKGAMLTHYNCVTANTQVRMTWSLREGKEVSLVSLPLFHVYGLNHCVNTGLSVGATIILHQRFNVDNVLRDIEKYKVTILYGVPTVYTALINNLGTKKYDLSSVRIWQSAAAPLHLTTKVRFKELTGMDIIEGWGLTEASPGLTMVPPGFSVLKPNCIGFPHPDTEVRVLDPESEVELGSNKVGELVARGPQVMKGYWNKPEETAKTLKGGWLHTGDLGYISVDGLFFFVDRLKDMINVSGFKVWPTEVEDMMLKHPSVREIAVVGSPDSYHGEVPKALVILKDEYKGRVTVEELMEFCKGKIATYKVPRKIDFVEDLPKTPSGKVLKRVLREKE
jgi:long-chain acyl-CoA synthetase